MTAATPGSNPTLTDAFALIERRAARARPVVGLALLAAAVSLIVTCVIAVSYIRQAGQLSAQATELQMTARDRDVANAALDRLARQLAAQTRTLGSPTATLAEIGEARSESQQLARLIPAAGAGEFVTPAATPNEANQLLTLGAGSGWDTDVFWCAGPGAPQNYEIGRRAAASLAQRAINQQQIAPGVRLGRIRLRPIRPGDTATWRAATADRQLLVVVDDGKGEAEAGQAILRSLPAGLRSAVINQSALPGGQAGSRWYISVVACPAA